MKHYVLLAAMAAAGIGVAQQSAPPAGMAGHWEGALDTPNGELPIEIDLAEESGTGWVGQISIPAQNTKGMALVDVQVKESALTFGLKAPGNPRFQGTLAAGGGTITGQMQQGPANLTFQLTRKGEAKIVKTAPITAISKELVGTWEGTLDVGAAQLRLRFELANDGAAGTGKIFSLDQGNAEIPVSGIKQEGARVKLDVATVNGGFEGEMKGNEMAGQWTQMGRSFPLTLTRAGAAAAK